MERQAEHKKKYEPLLKFLKKYGLKFKTAAVEKRTIEYFRMDHFRAFLEVRKKVIQKDERISKLL